jgi:hypothetical protein
MYCLVNAVGLLPKYLNVPDHCYPSCGPQVFCKQCGEVSDCVFFPHFCVCFATVLCLSDTTLQQVIRQLYNGQIRCVELEVA